MHIILISTAIILAFIGGGFFALNAFIYNEKQASESSPEVITEEVVVTSLTAESEKPTVPPSSKLSGDVLDLSGQGLSKVPESTFKRSDIERLDLSGNKLTGALPGEIRFMESLVSLDLSDNSFTGVPAEIGQLTKLEYLDLSNNPITGLPNELGNLSNLKVLNLSGTQYSRQDLETITKKLPKATDIQVD